MTYLRFKIGPLVFTQRLGKTKAERAAAAKHRADRATARRHDRQDARDHARWERERNAPEAVAAREDLARRTYRARVTQCRIDALTGGSFAFEAEGWPTARFTADADAAPRCAMLRTGDLVQAVLGQDGAVQEFRQCLRASGAEPRDPVEWSRSQHWFNGEVTQVSTGQDE